MLKVTSRLRIYRAPGSPVVAMSATATPSEISATIKNLGLRSEPVVLKSSPVQSHMKFISLRRPPNTHGPDGFEDAKGVLHPGYLAYLDRLYLRKFISGVKEGREVKRCLILCR